MKLLDMLSNFTRKFSTETIDFFYFYDNNLNNEEN